MTLEEQRRFPNRYAPFLQAIAIPTGGVFDAPFSSVKVSKQWAGVVIGALNALVQGGVWDGNETEQYDANQQVEELIAAIGSEVNMYQYPLGAVFPFVSDTLPQGFVLCDGTIYEQADYPDAFAALPELRVNGTQLQVPDLKARFIRTAHPSKNELLVSGGVSFVELTEANLPVHPHGYFYPSVGGKRAAAAGTDFDALTDIPVTLPTGNILDGNNDPVLAGDAFTTLPPFINLNQIIFLGS